MPIPSTFIILEWKIKFRFPETCQNNHYLPLRKMWVFFYLFLSQRPSPDSFSRSKWLAWYIIKIHFTVSTTQIERHQLRNLYVNNIRNSDLFLTVHITNSTLYDFNGYYMAAKFLTLFYIPVLILASGSFDVATSVII